MDSGYDGFWADVIIDCQVSNVVASPSPER